MNIKYLSPLSDLKAELKPLFSNEYMLAFFKKFCDAIKSRTWGFKKAKNARYEAEDFLRVFFYSCDVKSYMLEFENLVIIMMICLGINQTTKKSTSRWTNVTTRRCTAGNGSVLSFGDNVLTEKTTLLLQASQGSYGK